MNTRSGGAGGDCPCDDPIPSLEAMAYVLGALGPARLYWLAQGAAPEQHDFIMARATVDAIEMQRGQLLAPIDFGKSKRLTTTERAKLQGLDAAYLTAEEALRAAEEPLIAFARNALWQHKELLARWPEYRVLLAVALGGRRDRALALAAWLGFHAAPDDGAVWELTHKAI